MRRHVFTLTHAARSYAVAALLLFVASMPAVAQPNFQHIPTNRTGRITVVAFVPGNTSLLYVGSNSGGLYKTLDAGKTWIHLQSLPEAYIANILVDPVQPGIVVVSTHRALYRTVNGGTTWTVVYSFITPPSEGRSPTPDVSSPRFLARDKVDSQKLMAAIGCDGIAVSSDNGSTWATHTIASGVSNCVAYGDSGLDSNGSSAYMVTTYGGTYRSTDFGGHWTRVSYSGVDLQTVRYIAGQDKGFWFAAHTATSNEAYAKTTDLGNTWALVTLGSQGWTCRDLTSDGTLLYANLWPANVFVSSNGGQSWTITTNFPNYAYDYRFIAADPQSGSVYLAGDSGGVLRSDDHGASFVCLNEQASVALTDLDAQETYCISYNSQNNHLYYGMQDTGEGVVLDGVSVSAGAGDVLSIETDPYKSDVVYRLTNGGFFVGSDQSWGTVSSSLQTVPMPRKGGVIAVTQSRLWAGRRDGNWYPNSDSTFMGLYASDDGGATFGRQTLATGGINYLLAVAVEPRVQLYVACENGLAFSGNEGQSWSWLYRAAKVLTISLSGAHSLFIGTPSGALRSDDLGTTWVSSGDGLPAGTPVSALAVNPLDSSEVFAGLGYLDAGNPGLIFDGGLYWSSDGGRTWVPSNVAGPGAPMVTQIVAAPAVKKVFASTFGRGVYQASMIPATPTGVSAAAITSTRVDVTWNTVAGATYQIDRQAAGGGFSQIGTAATNSFSDTTASADSAYLYRVRAVNASGQSQSSAADLATTVIFLDNPLSMAGTLIKAVHLSQLRTAVNAVRLLAGLGSGSYTGAATSGTAIGAIHISELRSLLDAARGTLGFSTGGYSDISLSGVAIKAVHSQELRDRVK